MPRSFWQQVRYPVFACALLAAGGFSQVACSDATKPEPAPKQKPQELAGALAKFGDSTVTVEEFERRINAQSPYMRARYTSLDKKKEFLETLVRVQLMANEARRRGLDKTPEVADSINQQLMRELLKVDRASAKAVTDKETKDYYDANKNVYMKPEEVRASVIVVKDAATARKVLADPRLKGSESDLHSLASEYSEDAATKNLGGDLGFFNDSNKSIPKQYAEAAFNLSKEGDVSSPFKTKDGLAIIKLTGRHAAVVNSFEMVKTDLRNRLAQIKQDEANKALIAQLIEKANVTIDEAKLEAVHIDVPAAAAAAPPATPPAGSKPQAPPTGSENISHPL
jgi:peptidyl-prolyl cis-trans isomerase C